MWQQYKATKTINNIHSRKRELMEQKQTLSKHNTYPQGSKDIYSKHKKRADVSKEKPVRGIGCETM